MTTQLIVKSAVNELSTPQIGLKEVYWISMGENNFRCLKIDFLYEDWIPDMEEIGLAANTVFTI